MKIKKNIMFLIIVVLLLVFVSSSYATMTVPDQNGGGDDGGLLLGIANPILGIIQFIALAVAFGMIIILGIKYMTVAAGSRAEVKSTFLPYIIGAILVAGATKIVDIFWNMPN